MAILTPNAILTLRRAPSPSQKSGIQVALMSGDLGSNTQTGVRSIQHQKKR